MEHPKKIYWEVSGHIVAKVTKDLNHYNKINVAPLAAEKSREDSLISDVQVSHQGVKAGRDQTSGNVSKCTDQIKLTG